MVMLGHPIYFKTILNTERFSYDDGLLQHTCNGLIAPMPPHKKSKQRREAKKPKIRLIIIFFLVEIIHSKERS